MAPEDSVTRGKVAVMAQAAADMSYWGPPECLQPYEDHFHPLSTRKGNKASKHVDLRRKLPEYASLSCIPKEHPMIQLNDLDFWDYCLRKLFVQKATPLSKCINSLGPGASNLLPKLDDPSLPSESIINLDSRPREFTIAQWAHLVSVFRDWPFRPEDLSIDTFFLLNKDHARR
ncbi:hypothetical protein NLJ89_g5726 [Agrocybe chaxingu]|uniref:rRNA adenine N(6)-methyltransferase n=1 Tax=Agrocybe chaxingu TaxID=84603 RepID=A0A9W8JXY7_9AGAR|nr:hypothetical protein NLJ89_g5726 [Agrocybe chaxingu]